MGHYWQWSHNKCCPTIIIKLLQYLIAFALSEVFIVALRTSLHILTMERMKPCISLLSIFFVVGCRFFFCARLQIIWVVHLNCEELLLFDNDHLTFFHWPTNCIGTRSGIAHEVELLNIILWNVP